MDQNKLVGGLEGFIDQSKIIITDYAKRPPLEPCYGIPPVRE